MRLISISQPPRSAVSVRGRQRPRNRLVAAVYTMEVTARLVSGVWLAASRRQRLIEDIQHMGNCPA
jgi:hypothetical protein